MFEKEAEEYANIVQNHKLNCNLGNDVMANRITLLDIQDAFENVGVGVQSFMVGEYWVDLIECLEKLRQKYNETKDKRFWKELIRLLPESWLQKRTITMNYENVLNMVRQRSNHKLSEWSESFIDWAKTLPYADDLIFIGVGWINYRRQNDS